MPFLLRAAALVSLLALTPWTPLGAEALPTPAPSPSAAEAAFLATIMRDLPRRYPTTASAEAAGYVRFTNEDDTGAISYVNTSRWDSTDPDLPAQLWYDVGGRLIGADYSVRVADAPAGPKLFGIDPKRFDHINAHVHFVTCSAMAMGSAKRCTYDRAISTKKYAVAGDFTHPTAQGLVDAGVVKDPASVSVVFLYPEIYDVSVWVVPNPLGQFAEHNPAVTPSPAAGKGETM